MGGSEKSCANCCLNGNDSPAMRSSWIQSRISDLEENTKALLELIRLEDGDSFAKRAQMYYQKKPELEKRIEDLQRMYRLLADHCGPMQSNYRSSSITTLSARYENVALDPYESNPESAVDDIEPETHANKSDNFSVTNVSVENIQDIGNEELVRGSVSSIFDLLDTVEKRISCSEQISELVEDNRWHVDELTRRCEEKSSANKKLRDRIGKLVKENKLLHDQNNKLLNENRSVLLKLHNQIAENKNLMMCSRCSSSRTKSGSSQLARFKVLFMNAFHSDNKTS